ncbi:DMT family transporter [Corynebacterium sp. 320]|uniref:DMT family transporter n=1 Tax=Corynebacterium TaxID=1716 RepID=UPI00125CC142|nr:MULTISPECIES: DMT family transporter [Corynebacterium]KAB1504246.1 DMT family transporter [Corynebacterium sp. 320]KAB1552654.1 DMT family transporter [Corynebacterium sp. 321]KAB1554128.1 DMT family transporter [Corynebacterium sp. 319]KAB3528382.1 DMT family transporter [Corynebacterium sp. 250]KAB3540128.1 DMT family transporter [Corynebacterium sp. 366]
MMWIVIGVLAGAVMPVQTVANTRLSRSTGTPLSSSLISFLVGTLTLACALMLLNHGEMGLANALGGPWWMWLGGLLGVVALTGNILMFPRLGAVQTVVLPIAGQILMGLIIDHAGLFHSLQSPITVPRVVGAAIVMAGVLLTVVSGAGRRGTVASGDKGDTRDTRLSAWAWRGFGVLCGVLFASQAAINGHLGQVIAGPIAAALVSFSVGLGALIVLNVLQRWRPRATALEGEKNPWWMWIGGALGAAYVLLNALLVPQIGTGLTVVTVLSGLMAGSVVVERVRGQEISPRQLVGLVLIFAGVMVVDVL